MATATAHSSAAGAWALARSQHWVVARWQLAGLGFTDAAIRHRVGTGRVYPIYRGVYLVGHPELTLERRSMAAVLACGPGAALSHESAAALWRVWPSRQLEVSVPRGRQPHHPGVLVHRRAQIDSTRHRCIPVTTPVATLVDIATRLTPDELERAMNEAVIRDLTDPDSLRAALGDVRGRRGVRKLARILDRHTFVATDTVLEQRFLRIVRAADMPLPLTQAYVNGYRVDFHWPDLELVVEVDGLRFHRTPAQQAADDARNARHAAAGLIPLRFSHGQVFYEPGRVEQTLRAVAAVRSAR